jgi:hypothetical protein
MINYLNIYDQLQTIDYAKSKILSWHNTGLIISIILIVIILILPVTLVATYIYTKYTQKQPHQIKLDINEKTSIGICVCIIILIYIFLTLPAIKKKHELLSMTNIDITKMYTTGELNTDLALFFTTDINSSEMNDLLSEDDIKNLLTVNGVSNVTSLKENIDYLTNLYEQKKKTFKLLYNKDITISKNNYINSILNQFYLGKIDNMPTDITGFEEDYPRVSINLKK